MTKGRSTPAEVEEQVKRLLESLAGTRQDLEEELVLATARYWSRFGSGRHVEPHEVVRESEPVV